MLESWNNYSISPDDPLLPAATVGFAASNCRAGVSCRNPPPEYADGPDVHSFAILIARSREYYGVDHSGGISVVSYDKIPVARQCSRHHQSRRSVGEF
jgi:hypothetical protein